MGMLEMEICILMLLRQKAAILIGLKKERLYWQLFMRRFQNCEGSISAEHGIGQLKTDQLKDTKDAHYYRIMTQIKNTFDPKNLLNPNRIIK
jgi:FAD/FMN-containing dehydrogenase